MISTVRAIAVALLAATMAFTSPVLAEDLDAVKASGTLRVALSGAYPPFSFVNEENKVVGFDVDIGTEVAKRLGVKVEIVTTAWDGIIAGLIAGKFDTIVGSMTITEERAKSIDFVGPYYHGGRGVFVPVDSSIQSIADLKGKSVGVVLGELSEAWVRQQDGLSVTTYKGLPELLLEVGSGRVDAIAADQIGVLVAIKERNLALRELDNSGEEQPEAIGIALRKGNPQLGAAIQGALDAMMADGTYEQISIKWIGSDIR